MMTFESKWHRGASTLTTLVRTAVSSKRRHVVIWMMMTMKKTTMRRVLALMMRVHNVTIRLRRRKSTTIKSKKATKSRI